MSWNRSKSGDTSSDGRMQCRAALRFRFGKGALAGFVVVVGGVLIAWLILGSRNQGIKFQDTELSASGKIAEVMPHISTNKAAAKPKKYAELTRDEKLAYYRNKYGDNLPENLKPIVHYLENPPQRTFTMPKRPESIFKRHSERTIAAFLMAEPGNWVMQPIEFGAKFDADFAASLNEKIEFNDDDTDEQRELKQAVIDTKKELAERVKNGEKASDVMAAHSRQLYELGQYKSNLESQIRQVKNDPKMSDLDVEDAVNAANQMLKDRGLPPIKMPNMLIRRASLKIAARRAAEKAAQEQKK